MPTRHEQEVIDFLRRTGREDDRFWVRQACIYFGLPETEEMIGQIQMEATKQRSRSKKRKPR